MSYAQISTYGTTGGFITFGKLTNHNRIFHLLSRVPGPTWVANPIVRRILNPAPCALLLNKVFPHLPLSSALI